MTPPRIAYDARLSLGAYRGMGRYLRQLVAGREQQLLGLCATGESDPGLRLIAGGARAFPIWEQVSLPRLIRRLGIDVFLAPYNTAPLRLPPQTRLILVVHDLIYFDPLPLSLSLRQNAGRLYRQWVTPGAIARAERILTVSHYTAGQIRQRFGVAPERLRVLPVSVGEDWFAEQPAAPVSPAYILTVAGEAPSKNLHRALDAFAILPTQAADIRMKVAGVKPGFHSAFQRRAKALGIAGAVEFLPYVSDSEMRALYRGAQVLLMPSLAEGFGIPVLEAMASATPVAASFAASLPEVGGDAAAYFDPTSSEQMAEILHRMLFDRELRVRMIERGRMQARRFHPRSLFPAIEAFWDELAHDVKKKEPSWSLSHGESPRAVSLPTNHGDTSGRI